MTHASIALHTPNKEAVPAFNVVSEGLTEEVPLGDATGVGLESVSEDAVGRLDAVDSGEAEAALEVEELSGIGVVAVGGEELGLLSLVHEVHAVAACPCKRRIIR